MDRAEIVGLLELEKHLPRNGGAKGEWLQQAVAVLLKAELARLDYEKYISQ